jgi:Tol biopolymer transport system component
MNGDDNRQLYLLDVEGKELPQKLAGQDPSRDNVLSCWSADGKKIVFASSPANPAENKSESKTLMQRILNLQ